MTKSLLVTYFLWFFAGWTGIHHFYLGRDNQFLLWFQTFACFGIGWFRDLFRIPDYVAQANLDANFKRRIKHEILAVAPKENTKDARPTGTWTRLLGQLFFGYWYAIIVGGVMEDYGLPYSFLFATGFSLGWYTAGTAGYVSADLRRVFSYTAGCCIAGSILHLLVYGTHLENLTLLSAVPAYLAFRSSARFMDAEQQQEAVNKRESRGFCRRGFRNAMIHGLFLVCVTGSFIQNAKLEVEGETLKVKDHLKNLLNSPIWGEAADVFQEFRGHWQEEGWEQAWAHMASRVDIEGEGQAYQILGLEKGASLREVKSAYRHLAGKWHPDKNPNNPDAEAKFREIADAYNTLKNILKRRKHSSGQEPEL